ncbi:hypothetical protein [Geovibrio ferrireducens]|jgi:uncharacterized protein YbaR (Trm112 family)/nitrogen fixation-related uncharacterized protein|uniref:hypothetical protein n=1 Tax=Geovibrio ferrireducens TaxID=46201 RepID=UPI0022453517|nr:hypothetical protein [Geovibrio ferrireducens]
MKDKFIEQFKERIVSIILAPVSIFFLWSLQQLTNGLYEKMEPIILEHISKRLLGVAVIMEAVMIIILLFVVYILKPKGMSLKYAIYWDKDKNPHCPSCKKPLNSYDDYGISGIGFYCNSCNLVHPMSKKGIYLTISEARKIMDNM